MWSCMVFVWSFHSPPPRTITPGKPSPLVVSRQGPGIGPRCSIPSGHRCPHRSPLPPPGAAPPSGLTPPLRASLCRGHSARGLCSSTASAPVTMGSIGEKPLASPLPNTQLGQPAAWFFLPAVFFTSLAYFFQVRVSLFFLTIFPWMPPPSRPASPLGPIEPRTHRL